MRNLAFIALLIGLPGCIHQASVSKVPAHYVEAGNVTPHGAWAIKKELSNAGIAAYTDGTGYPSPYRILVAPEQRKRASALIEEIKSRPSAAGY